MNAPPPKSMPELRLLKGTADQSPQSQIRRQAVINIIRETFETFGFNPLETPILSHFDILSLKYGPDDPILEEIYHVADRGKRDLGLRYDLTTPLCRFVGMALEGHFSLPFKRYEIGKVFRDGPVKEGRLREFAQCDADVIGSNDPAVDAELLAVADRAFERMGLPVEIELNSRKVLWAILEEGGLDAAKREAATTVVDKWDKVGPEEVARELRELDLAPEAIERIFALLAVGDGGAETLKALDEALKSDLGREGLSELTAVCEALEDFKLVAPVRVTPRLARGLAIYTGIIFEFFCRDRSLIGSSIAAGGRYNRIVGEFLHPNNPERHGDYPCSGVSFGIEPITVALDKLGGAEGGRQTVTEVLVVPMEARREAFALAADLRRRGVKTDVDLSGAKLRKTFKRVNALGIPYMVLLGEDELTAGEVSFRDMDSGEQTRLPLDRAAEEIALRCGVAPGM
jgi:histidyl-tRNA synthetase